MSARSDAVDRMPDPTPQAPWVVLLSGCLAGMPVRTDGTPATAHALLAALRASPLVRVVSYCPEDVALGTPRGMPDIHGGDGFDVLAGRARVRLDDGRDVTEPMLEGARRMLAHAQREQVRVAVLMDLSAACGSQVISDGPRLVADRRYQRGHGVAAALLAQHGVLVLAQRDARSLDHLLHRLDPAHPVDPAALDHDESDWVRAHLPRARSPGPGRTGAA